jgi:PAS domain S-box-containing protein
MSVIRTESSSRRDEKALLMELGALGEDAGGKALLRATLEQTALGIALCALNEAAPRWLHGNQTLCGMLGYTREEFLRLPPVEIEAPDEAHAREQHARLFESGRIGLQDRGEQRYRRKDGSVFPVSVTRTIVRDAGGSPLYSIAVIEDITERKRTEAERARLAAIVEQSGYAIVSRTADGTVLTWNRAAERLFGYTAAEMVGRSAAVLLPPGRLHELGRGFEDAGSATVHHYESTRLTKSGGLIDVSISASRITDARGNVESVSLTFGDITLRKRAEAQMRVAAGVFAHAAEGIVIVDHSGDVMLVNPAFTKITGYGADDVVGKSARVLAAGWRFQERYDDMWRQVGETGAWEGDIWDTRANNEQYCVHLSVSVIPDGNGEPAQYCMILMDITAHKIAKGKLLQLNANLERRVARRTAELQAVNQELEAFSFSVSHDLRAPLRAVRGFSKLLQGVVVEDQPESAAVAYAQKIEENVERMESLIRDLLKLSSLARQDIRRQSVDASAMAEAELALLRDFHRERRVECSVTPGMTALADPGLFRIVLQNLIGNAWKFTALADPARIDIGMEEHDGAMAYFVRDNGAGFDMRYADKLFAPFQRLHPRKEFEGTGVGLSIVQRIVGRHGGRVWASAAPGAGATFFFTIG